MSDAFVELVTALADDELVIGHRHSEWTGWAPHIEEDVAFSSIAQDEIGHAGNLYALLGESTGRDPDALALGRSADAYRHAVICERPNRDWAYTLARHWLYDHADDMRLEALENSSHEGLGSLVRKIRREERWHLMHADTWMRRVAHGPVDGRTKLIAALGSALPESLSLFDALPGESECLERGWIAKPAAEMRDSFLAATIEALDDLGLPAEIHDRLDAGAEFVASSSGDLIESDGDTRRVPAPAAAPRAEGGRAGRHTEDFERLWDAMTETYRNDPGASW